MKNAALSIHVKYFWRYSTKSDNRWLCVYSQKVTNSLECKITLHEIYNVYNFNKKATLTAATDNKANRIVRHDFCIPSHS